LRVGAEPRDDFDARLHDRVLRDGAAHAPRVLRLRLQKPQQPNSPPPDRTRNHRTRHRHRTNIKNTIQNQSIITVNKNSCNLFLILGRRVIHQF